MIKLNKKKTKAFAIRWWWTNYIYWIPTIQTELHLISDSCLTNISIKNNYSAEGNILGININILGLIINIEYWWKLKEDNYGKNKLEK